MDRTLPVLALAAALALVALLSVRRVWSADFWWEWKTGELVAASGPPRVDVFSYTAAGREWIELRWLYCLALYRLVRAGGPGAAVAVTAALVLAAFLLAAAAGHGARRPALAAAVLAVAGLASSQRFVVRPEVASFALLGLYLLLLQRWREGRRRALWAIPPLQALWANLHPLFAMGPALVGLLALETLWLRRGGREARPRELREVLLVLSATVAACLANPYGLEGALFPLRLFGQLHGTAFKAGIEEFASPLCAAGLRFLAVRWWLVLVALVLAVALVLRRRLEPFWAATAAAGLYLSLTSFRSLPLFALAAVPFLLLHAPKAAAELPAELRARLPTLRRAACAAVLALAAFYGWQAATDRLAVLRNDTNQFGLGVARHRFPVRAAGFLSRGRLPGPVFATMRESSYLLARGVKVFFDPRNDVYGPEHFARFLAMEREPEAWRRAEAEHGFRTAVLDVRSAFNNRVAEAGWTLVHFDEVAAVWVRGPPPPGVAPLATAADHGLAAAAVREGLPRPVPLHRAPLFGRVASPLPYRAVGEFLLFRGFPELARPFLEDAAAADPFAPGA